MPYLPKSIVEKRIKVRVRKGRAGKDRRDYEAYLGTDPFTRKIVRITRESEADLRRELADFYARHRVGGDAAVRLTAMQALDAKHAYDALAAANIKTTLYEAVCAYVGGASGQDETRPQKSAAEAFEEYYDSKAEGADKAKTKATTGKWVCMFGDRPLSSLNAREILDYLNENYGERKPKTYNSHLLYIKTFLNWCCKEERGYLAKNPIRSLKFKPEPWEEPEYMAPGDVERMFRLLESRKAVTPELLAYAVVSFFCGCRAVEIMRMATDPDAAKIDLDGATVRIAKAKGYQQGKRPRAFPIHPTALAWMRSFDFQSALRRVTSDTQKEIYDLARRHGIPVFQNCGRHTFITYHVAAYNEPSKTTAMVGTSEKMRAENYCGLAKRIDGEAYFRILPSGAAA